MNVATLAALRAARAGGKAVALCTWLDGRDQQVVTLAEAPPALAEAIAIALRASRSQLQRK